MLGVCRPLCTFMGVKSSIVILIQTMRSLSILMRSPQRSGRALTRTLRERGDLMDKPHQKRTHQRPSWSRGEAIETTIHTYTRGRGVARSRLLRHAPEVNQSEGPGSPHWARQLGGIEGRRANSGLLLFPLKQFEGLHGLVRVGTVNPPFARFTQPSG